MEPPYYLIIDSIDCDTNWEVMGVINTSQISLIDTFKQDVNRRLVPLNIDES